MSDVELKGQSEPDKLFTLELFRETIPKLFTPLSQSDPFDKKLGEWRKSTIQFLLSMQPPDTSIPTPADALNDIALKTHQNQSRPVLADVNGFLQSCDNLAHKKMWNTVEAFYKGKIPEEYKDLAEFDLESGVQRHIYFHEALSHLSTSGKITEDMNSYISSVIHSYGRDNLDPKLYDAIGKADDDNEHRVEKRKKYIKDIASGGTARKTALKMAAESGIFSSVGIPGLGLAAEDVKYYSYSLWVLQQMEDIVSSMVKKA